MCVLNGFYAVAVLVAFFLCAAPSADGASATVGGPVASME